MLTAALLALAPLASPDDLEDLEARMRLANEPETKIAILDEIADAYGGASQDSGHTELVIVTLLEDDEVEVRVHAAELLGARLDAGIAIEGMLRAIDEMSDEEAELEAESERNTEKLRLETDKKEPDYGALLGLLGTQLTIVKGMQALDEIRVAIGRSLAMHRDDRCVEGIGTLLPEVLHKEESLELVGALLDYGTRPAIGAVVATFEGIDELRDGRERARKRLAKEKARPKPRGHPASNTEWRKAEKKRLKAQIDAFDEQTEALEERLVKIAKRTSAFAKERGLQKAPRNARKTNWVGWWERNREQLPESLKDR